EREQDASGSADDATGSGDDSGAVAGRNACGVCMGRWAAGATKRTRALHERGGKREGRSVNEPSVVMDHFCVVTGRKSDRVSPNIGTGQGDLCRASDGWAGEEATNDASSELLSGTDQLVGGRKMDWICGCGAGHGANSSVFAKRGDNGSGGDSA